METVNFSVAMVTIKFLITVETKKIYITGSELLEPTRAPWAHGFRGLH